MSAATAIAGRGTSLSLMGTTKADEIESRRIALGLNVIELAKRAGVDRGRLAKFLQGELSPRAAWIGAVEKALTDAEGGTIEPEQESSGPGVVRFTVRNVYGVEALVVEGPVHDIAELEASVDRIMRRIQGKNGEAETIVQPTD